MAGVAPAKLAVQWTRSDERAWEAALHPPARARSRAPCDRELPDRLAAALCRRQASIAAGRSRSFAARNASACRRRSRAASSPGRGTKATRRPRSPGGGVALDEVDPSTMESRRHPGLFLCGEILDAFGPIGGLQLPVGVGHRDGRRNRGGGADGSRTGRSIPESTESRLLDHRGPGPPEAASRSPDTEHLDPNGEGQKHQHRRHSPGLTTRPRLAITGRSPHDGLPVSVSATRRRRKDRRRSARPHTPTFCRRASREPPPPGRRSRADLLPELPPARLHLEQRDSARRSPSR